ncbi:MAG: glycerate kinase [Candidatus Omnitrophica bacterium]|nr:glycerate kinase [Candidatus Omnitrophota bacterium]
MKIVIAPDSFKGSLTSLRAAQVIKKGLSRALPGANYLLLPISDGGEGLVEILFSSLGGRRIWCGVSGPLGRPVRASFLILPDTALTSKGSQKTAVIEMAQASGLYLLKPSERNPLLTSTYGTGQLIADALKSGIRRVIVGVGGSATVDGGMGMARALGVRFLDKSGAEIIEGGGGLGRLDRIDSSGLNPAVRKTEIIVASDVNNPLVGKEGAANIFGPQKGATPDQVKILDRNLVSFARIIRRDLGKEVSFLPGAGAAGGLGAGLCAFLDAEIKSGIDLVLGLLNFSPKAKDADLIVTGEGRIDGQVKFGKVLFGLGKTAQKLKIPLVAFCGSYSQDAFNLHDSGITAFFSILPGPCRLPEAMEKGEEFLLSASTEVGFLLRGCYSRM